MSPNEIPPMAQTSFWSAVFQQAAKDLRTSFRDRSTLIQTILVPLALYPVMFWLMLQASTILEGQKADRVVRVDVVTDDGQAGFAADLIEEWKVPDPEVVDPETAGPEALGPKALGPKALGEDPSGPAALDESGEQENEEENTGLAQVEAKIVESGGLSPKERLFSDDPTDAVLVLQTTAEGRVISIHTDSARASSLLAGERLAEWLDHRGHLERVAQAKTAGSTLDELAPFGYERIDVSEAEELGAFVLSLLLPLMLVVMGTLGAFYPAVDLTAGEHERRTHETTLLAPVPRMAIQLGKVLAVTTCSVLAATMNLIGMALAANHLLGMLGGIGISFKLPIANLLLALPFAAAFLLFVSAVLCAAASLTRTFKQGQSLLGTVQMAFLLPAMVTSMPTLQLTAGLAAVPVVGVALAFRTLLRGGPLADLPVVPLILVLVFQILFAVLALALSLRLLDQAPDGDAEQSAGDRLRQLLSRSRP